MKKFDFSQASSRIKDLRAEKKMSQADVAKALNISRVVYNRYENGKRSMPIEILYDLCELFNESADYIIGRID